ncbi:MAG: Inosose isomerase, partial [uncultured Thermomicrobiales bacterium]
GGADRADGGRVAGRGRAAALPGVRPASGSTRPRDGRTQRRADVPADRRRTLPGPPGSRRDCPRGPRTGGGGHRRPWSRRLGPRADAQSPHSRHDAARGTDYHLPPVDRCRRDPRRPHGRDLCRLRLRHALPGVAGGRRGASLEPDRRQPPSLPRRLHPARATRRGARRADRLRDGAAGGRRRQSGARAGAMGPPVRRGPLAGDRVELRSLAPGLAPDPAHPRSRPALRRAHLPLRRQGRRDPAGAARCAGHLWPRLVALPPPRLRRARLGGDPLRPARQRLRGRSEYRERGPAQSRTGGRRLVGQLAARPAPAAGCARRWDV